MAQQQNERKQGSASSRRVRDVMTANPVTVSEKDSIRDVARWSMHRPLPLSPDLAARVAINMVRLLLTRTNVISMTLTMLGENLKGSGQFGLAFLTYP